jgi:uncharacterized protein YifN (PemK superfamily)
MQGTAFWHVIPCSPVRIERRVRRTYHLHLHGERISETGNQQQTSGWQSQTSVEFSHSYRCEHLKSKKCDMFPFCGDKQASQFCRSVSLLVRTA